MVQAAILALRRWRREDEVIDRGGSIIIVVVGWCRWLWLGCGRWWFWWHWGGGKETRVTMCISESYFVC